MSDRAQGADKLKVAESERLGASQSGDLNKWVGPLQRVPRDVLRVVKPFAGRG